MPPAPRSSPARAGMDLSEMVKMVDPLEVHVTRLRGGNNRETIPLPPRLGQIHSHVGWTVDEVKSIEQEIIPISGGGTYEVQVTDSSEPDRRSTKWVFIIPTDVHPSRPPSTLGDAISGVPQMVSVAQVAQMPQMPPQMAQVVPLQTSSASPGSPPQMAIVNPYTYASQPQYVQVQQPQQQQPQQQPYSTPIRSGYGGGVSGDNRDRERERETQLREELHKRDLEVTELRHQHERQIAELKQAIAQAAQAQAQAQANNPRFDDRIEREREARERAERDAAAAREAAAREVSLMAAKLERAEEDRRRESDLARLEGAMAEERRRADEKFSALMLQMQQLSQRPAGPDPLLMMLIESQKTSAEAQREAARINAEAGREASRLQAEVEKERARADAETVRLQADSQRQTIATMQAMLAPNQMSPMEAARIVREASSGADQFTRTMIGNMNDLLGFQQQFMANIMQMAPQSSGIGERIVDAVEKIGETWTKSTAQAEAAKANAQAGIATAQAGIANAQAEIAKARMGGSGGGASSSGGLAGTGATQPAQPVQSFVAQAPQATTDDQPRRNGRTDAEWFGPALPDVERLRGGVQVYLDAVAGETANLDQKDEHEPITIVDNKGNIVGVPPYLAAQFLLIAAREITSKNIPGVEAFTYFYAQQMYPALMEVTLPNAPQQYRDDVIRFFHKLLKGEVLYKEGDPHMFGIEPFLSDDDGDGDGA